MKIILTGATGFLGSEVLQQCIQSNEVDSIVVLTRKPLQAEQLHEKVNNIIVKDFRSYSEDVIEAISDADACIWCLGGTDPAIEIDYPKTLTQAIQAQPNRQSKPFTYVHCSGILAERDQTKPLWFMQEGRRAKGQAETMLLEIAKENQSEAATDTWRTYIMRPSMILPKNVSFFQILLSYLLGSVMVDDLARASIKLAVHGNGSATLENNDLAELGRLKSQS